MSDKKSDASSERHIPLSTAATAPVYGALGATLYNRPYLDGGTLLSFETLANIELKTRNNEFKNSTFSPFVENELRYATMAADMIKKDPLVRAYFPPTISGLQELSAVLHMRESQKNTEKLLDDAMKGRSPAPFANYGPDGGIIFGSSTSASADA